MYMKPFTSRLAGNSTLFLFPLLYLFLKKRKLMIWLLLPAFVLIGCFQNFFDTNTKRNPTPDMISQLQTANKLFIIHYSDSTYALEEMKITDNVLYATQIPVPEGFNRYSSPDTTRSNFVK